jgi:hypothetical protein
MAEIFNPAALMANFAAYVNGSKVSDKWRLDARPAAAVLVDLLLPNARITDNAFMRSFNRSIIVKVRRQLRYRDIWSMGLVLDGIRKAQPVDRLSWGNRKRDALSS